LEEKKEEEQIVIGLTGSIGSGCTEIAREFLEKKNDFEYISLSTIIKEEVEKQFKEEGKERKPNVLDYQNYGNDLRKYGLDAVAKKTFENKSELRECYKKLVIDSIRNCGEIYYLRDNFPNFYLLGVYADENIRWKRLEEKYEGSSYLFKQAEKRDKGEVWEYGQQVSACMELADIIIINNDDIHKYQNLKTEFFEKLEEFYLNLIKLPGIREPFEMEVYMNNAYTASLESRCVKRQVGATIVDTEKKIIISKGHNRIPDKLLLSCFDKFKNCYRDIKRKDLLEEFKKCSACGETHFEISGKCKNENCNYESTEQLKSKIKMLELCRALHAEEDAILKALKLNFNNFENTILYTTTYPCLMCAKKIISVGIKNIVFVEPYPVEMAKEILEEAKVKVTIFEGVKSQAFYKLFKIERDFIEKYNKKK